MKLFLDTCIWFAGIHSEGGGSARILSEIEERKFEIVATEDLIEEIGCVVNRKLGKIGIEKLKKIIGKSSVTVHPATTTEERKIWIGVTADKDCLVLAGALKCNADILVTLDKEHLLIEKVKSRFPIEVVNTKEFWKRLL